MLKTPSSRPEILVLQGGGALGAYQAGVYDALHARGTEPQWCAGISIGAINAAIIAGNAPDDRVAQLRGFWELVSAHLPAMAPADSGPLRRLFNESAANIVAAFGAPGFFQPRLPQPFATSIYDTAPLRDTLLDLIDFDRINAREMRLSVGAVNVLTGNLTWFDNHTHTIAPEHIMASGALPPGFGAVEIDGVPYWDGGLVSNTPLQYVLDEAERCDMTIYQIDLFHARGELPRDLSEVLQREKDIRYSSRTRFNTDAMQGLEELRLAAARLAEKLPEELRDDPDLAALTAIEGPGAVRVLHIINRREGHESYSKDYEFSRATVNDHWRTGAEDAAASLGHDLWAKRDQERRGVLTYDLTNPLGPRVRGGASSLPDS